MEWHIVCDLLGKSYMKKLFIFALVLISTSCEKTSVKETESIDLGKRLNFQLSNAAETDDYVIHEIKEFEVKTKWYIGVKKYIDGVKKCKSGFGICKLKEIYPKIKFKTVEGATNIGANESVEMNDADSELVVELYEKYLKVSIPNSPKEYVEESIFENMNLENIYGLLIEGKSFKSIQIKAGLYKVHKSANGNAFILLDYQIKN
ncbi:MAG: hypothetical protein RIR90_987 [Bacteroidota bacterium]